MKKVLYVDDNPREIVGRLQEAAEAVRLRIGLGIQVSVMTADATGTDPLYLDEQGDVASTSSSILPTQVVNRHEFNDAAQDGSTTFVLDVHFGEERDLHDYGIRLARYLRKTFGVSRERIILITKYPDKPLTFAGDANQIWRDYINKAELLQKPKEAQAWQLAIYLQASIDRGLDGGAKKPVGYEQALKSLTVQTSAKWQSAMGLAHRYATLGARPVLLHGEPGTGKGIVARYIHQQSSRRGGGFIEFAPGATNDQLVSAELYGYKKGAFSGADADKDGLLHQYNAGTLFLDEIGDLSESVQGKLKQLFNEWLYLPLGAVETKTFAGAFVTATWKALDVYLIPDLHDRLRPFKLEIPSLRERPEDIVPLFRYYLSASEFNHSALVFDLTSSAEGRLREYGWPQNVRELQQCADRTIMAADRLTRLDARNIDLEASALSANAMVMLSPSAQRHDPVPSTSVREQGSGGCVDRTQSAIESRWLAIEARLLRAIGGKDFTQFGKLVDQVDLTNESDPFRELAIDTLREVALHVADHRVTLPAGKATYNTTLIRRIAGLIYRILDQGLWSNECYAVFCASIGHSPLPVKVWEIRWGSGKKPTEKNVRWDNRLPKIATLLILMSQVTK